jgi:outer membrane biosynthesis protein TonB
MNRSRPITFLASGAAILLIAVGVASCGGSNDNSSNSPAAAKQSQPPVVANSAPAPAAKPAPAPAAKPAPAPAAKPAKQVPPTPRPAPAPQPSASSNGIPQGDVGDNDADNHGGPDDGDGGI